MFWIEYKNISNFVSELLSLLLVAKLTSSKFRPFEVVSPAIIKIFNKEYCVKFKLYKSMKPFP